MCIHRFVEVDFAPVGVGQRKFLLRHIMAAQEIRILFDEIDLEEDANIAIILTSWHRSVSIMLKKSETS